MLKMRKTVAATALLLAASSANALFLECYNTRTVTGAPTVAARLTWDLVDILLYPIAYMYTTAQVPDRRNWSHQGRYFLPDMRSSAIVHRLRTPGIGWHRIGSTATSWRWDWEDGRQIVNPDRPQCNYRTILP